MKADNAVIDVACIVGARPNFMKMAAVLEGLRRHSRIRPILIHTGQHYDAAMSKVFFDELGLPKPDYDLGVGSDTHARQTAAIMTALDALLDERPPALAIVVGDVNSTLAGALVASKRGIPVAHVEAGLRSRDRSMPEELNRIVTDALSDLLFATSRDAVDNLTAEGIPASRILFVGNPMIDTLLRHIEIARERAPLVRFGLEDKSYAMVTLHRPQNVDDPRRLLRIFAALESLSADIPVVFPVHPRTLDRIGRMGESAPRSLRLLEPLGYLDFIGLLDRARMVLTDSGGIQEEATLLGIPCLTLRDNTERPVTITAGTNRIVGSDPGAILAAARRELNDPMPPRGIPELWDGQAGARIADAISAFLIPRAEAACDPESARPAGLTGSTSDC